ncbi:CRISPR-associated protein Cas2 [alpha proteobacterium AAP81b]|nr:CRISPR-associated protein Cas2 [alpha proteobacterium AAP81b]
MWILAMFDLPVESKADRRAYADFRKLLLGDGFSMMQFSVYIRHCASIENADVHMKRVGAAVPARGEVRLLMITDNQFGRMQVYTGKKRGQPPPAPAQLQLF